MNKTKTNAVVQVLFDLLRMMKKKIMNENKKL